MWNQIVSGCFERVCSLTWHMRDHSAPEEVRRCKSKQWLKMLIMTLWKQSVSERIASQTHRSSFRLHIQTDESTETEDNCSLVTFLHLVMIWWRHHRLWITLKSIHQRRPYYFHKHRVGLWRQRSSSIRSCKPFTQKSDCGCGFHPKNVIIKSCCLNIAKDCKEKITQNNDRNLSD